MFEKVFKLSENKTTVKTEVVAGLTTFMTMAYILAVNPSILSAAFCITSGSVLIATVIVVGTSTRMFWAEMAPVSLQSICKGFIDRNS